MQKYYDPEYDREVDESVIKHQYEWFSKHSWFTKSYDQFKSENFREIKTDQSITQTDELSWKDIITAFRNETSEKFVKLDEMTAGDIEEYAKSVVLDIIQDNALEAEILDVFVTGSRSRGIEFTDSDLDVVVFLQSELREDFLFNLIHEQELKIGEVILDINPIVNGDIEQYLQQAEAYLRVKAKTKELTIYKFEGDFNPLIPSENPEDDMICLFYLIPEKEQTAIKEEIRLAYENWMGGCEDSLLLNDVLDQDDLCQIPIGDYIDMWLAEQNFSFLNVTDCEDRLKSAGQDKRELHACVVQILEEKSPEIISGEEAAPKAETSICNRRVRRGR